MRSERRDLRQDTSRTETRCNSLASEISTLQTQKAALERSVTTARDLWQKSEHIVTASTPVKDLVSQKLHEYQALKEATDSFTQWTATAQDHTETMMYLGGSEASLRAMTKRMLETLLSADHTSIKAICAPLKKLSICERCLFWFPCQLLFTDSDDS